MKGAQIPRPTGRRPRRGTALVLVLIAVVVLAVLSTGAILGSMQELRAAHNEQMAQRALTVAEYGLHQQLSDWSSARSQLANGAIDSTTIAVAAGDTASVKIMRLNSRTFWVVSVGRTNRSSGRLEAQRQVSMLVSVKSGAITPGAALTTYKKATLDGSSLISGTNTTPPGWLNCAGMATTDTFGVAYNPNSSASTAGNSKILGGTKADPKAADTTTFTVFGGETWASLVQQADYSVGQNMNPMPTGTATTCTLSSTNWGEPLRSNGAIVGCQSYFPIIYSSGQLELTGNGRGQGILIVDGDLHISGNFTFVGLILVRGMFHPEGNSKVYGAVMDLLKSGSEAHLDGNASLYYSPCAVGMATNRLGGTPARTKQRAWAQLYQ
jgi:Tfp pilus assembly protein PilX